MAEVSHRASYLIYTVGCMKKIANEQIITTCGAALLIAMSVPTKIFYQQLLSCYLESIAAQSGKCVSETFDKIKA